MALAPALRRPVSTRHAFALAFDLTLLRDPLHSMVVPFLLRGPWVLAGLPLAAEAQARPSWRTLLPLLLVGVGGFVTSLAVSAMLRFRARSVFNTPHGIPPAPAAECYRRGLHRVPWLYVTEFVRNSALSIGFSMAFVPGLYLGYKLAFMTEAVVLDDRNLFGAFEHTWHLARGRFERWLEMVAVSAFIVLAAWFAAALVYVVAHPALSVETVLNAVALLLLALLPVFEYAWTFFYLRLIEVEEPQIHESGPFKTSSGMVGPWSSRGVPRPGSRSKGDSPPSYHEGD